jgi:hypothetical protein
LPLRIYSLGNTGANGVLFKVLSPMKLTVSQKIVLGLAVILVLLVLILLGCTAETTGAKESLCR